MTARVWAGAIGSAIAATVLSLSPALAQDYSDRVVVPGPEDPIGAGAPSSQPAPGTASRTVPIVTIPDAVDATFYRNNPPTHTDQNIFGQLQWILGLPFPENGTNADSRNLSRLYYELQKRQSLADPWIRTQDIPNPYNGSLLQMQRSTGDSSVNP